MIQPIKKVNVSEEVFLHMKQLIIEKKWNPGDKIPSEAELGKSYGVSRITVRNALQKLVALELIETRLGDGSYVRKNGGASAMNSLVPTAYFETDVEVILEFRREMESGTCAIAAEKATPEDIAALKEMLGVMDDLQSDLEKLALADLEFHYKIAHISRNSLIIKTYEIISDIYTIHMKHIVAKMGGELGVYYHQKIVEAIEQHDATSARNYMLHHLKGNIDFIEKEHRKET